MRVWVCEVMVRRETTNAFAAQQPIDSTRCNATTHAKKSRFSPPLSASRDAWHTPQLASQAGSKPDVEKEH
jgi:hypothetical protein